MPGQDVRITERKEHYDDRRDNQQKGRPDFLKKIYEDGELSQETTGAKIATVVNKDGLKAQQAHSPGQAQRHPGYELRQTYHQRPERAKAL